MIRSRVRAEIYQDRIEFYGITGRRTARFRLSEIREIRYNSGDDAKPPYQVQVDGLWQELPFHFDGTDDIINAIPPRRGQDNPLTVSRAAME